MIRKLALTAVSALVIPAQASAEPISLGSYAIGMSIDEAKSAPIKGLVSDGAYALTCSGEPDVPVSASDEEKAEGVVSCVASTADSFRTRAPMYFGNIILDPLFRFSGGRLFEIIIVPHINWRERFTDAAILKFGKPTKTSVTTASNAFGASWPMETSVWATGVQELVVEAPSLSRDKFLIVYRDKPLAAKIEARLRARKAAGAGI